MSKSWPFPIRVALTTRHRYMKIKNLYNYDPLGELRYMIEKHLRDLEKRLEKENPQIKEIEN